MSQSNVTLTEVEQEFLKLNYEHMSDRKIAMRLGISKNKLYQNRILMKLFRRGETVVSSREIKEEMFDHRKFAKFP